MAIGGNDSEAKTHKAKCLDCPALAETEADHSDRHFKQLGWKRKRIKKHWFWQCPKCAAGQRAMRGSA